MSRALQLKVVCALLLVMGLIAGCGYHAVTPRGPLADGKGVNITLFTNKTYRSGLEGTLARAMVDEFALRNGNVLPREKAQLELVGVINSYSTVAVSFSSQNTIKEYRVIITVQATLREQQTQKVVWKGDLSESQTFPVNQNLALQQNAEEAAAVKACRRISEDVWVRIGEAY
ncbi:LPS assembly lipoprotein LptE [Geomonas sp.]|uniref:LPS assembly lipoprotein LptE n=1 Tax=Geomonas sp. TaxID=2651584 RepID=UPI002B47E5ED|nr:LPS assembly lipoprotein LptE [Geomonas sp.]HJV36088.1 LPS assembly lipoprotein LptE [Geomonas sp.]